MIINTLVVYYLQDQMTGKPSSPVLMEILDLPGTAPVEGGSEEEEEKEIMMTEVTHDNKKMSI